MSSQYGNTFKLVSTRGVTLHLFIDASIANYDNLWILNRESLASVNNLKNSNFKHEKRMAFSIE